MTMAPNGDDRFVQDDLAPENANSEQDESGTQAQDVAEDARTRGTDLSEGSERGGKTDPTELVPQDMSDLVEKMQEMTRSGHVDMDAYAGEPAMDDEEDSYGDSEGSDE